MQNDHGHDCPESLSYVGYLLLWGLLLGLAISLVADVPMVGILAGSQLVKLTVLVVYAAVLRVWHRERRRRGMEDAAIGRHSSRFAAARSRAQ